MSNRIKDLRRENMMSQKDLALELGVTQSTISQWENAHFSPDHSALMFLSYIFKCPADYILGVSPTQLPGKRGWTKELELNTRAYLMQHNTYFVQREEERSAETDAAEQAWLQWESSAEDPAEKAQALEAYWEDCWDKAGRPGTLEGFYINMMTEKLSIAERRKLLNVVKAMFPEVIEN